MEKNRLLLLPFLAGLILLGYSWYQSYPLVSNSTNDFIFNHVSILYWISLPLLLASMFLIAVTTRSNFLKWMLTIGIVLTFFSISYFFSMMPTPDSNYFRGLTEYFMETRSLDPSQFVHNYYQWPSFFILAEIVTSVSGLSLANYEFLLYTIIAVLLITSLYFYASRKQNISGFIVVIIFFMSINYFINYQAVPFSIALGLLFLLFMLETRQKRTGLIITMIVLYASLLLTHLFVPLFFVLYLLIRSLLDRNKQNRSRYGGFFLLGLVSFFLVQLTIAEFSLGQISANLTTTPAYTYMVSVTTAHTVPIPINTVAQSFSRIVTITVVILCIAGSAFLLIRRRMRNLDKAIFLTGLLYTLGGSVLNTLGERGIAIIFIPLALGAGYLFKTRFRKYFISILLVLLILFLFIPLHQSFNSEIQFQTKETYAADNFFINHYHWTNPGVVVSDFRTNLYLTTKLSVTQIIQSWFNLGEKVDGILYTPETGLELGNYSSMQSLSQGENLNVMYNDGLSFILINSQP